MPPNGNPVPAFHRPLVQPRYGFATGRLVVQLDGEGDARPFDPAPVGQVGDEAQDDNGPGQDGIEDTQPGFGAISGCRVSVMVPMLYLPVVDDLVKKLRDEIATAKGVRLTRQYQMSPILGELYKPVPPRTHP